MVDNHFILAVSIPPGTKAEIWIPMREHAIITENNQALENSPLLHFTKYENGYGVVEAGSGDYVFATPF